MMEMCYIKDLIANLRWLNFNTEVSFIFSSFGVDDWILHFRVITQELQKGSENLDSLPRSQTVTQYLYHNRGGSTIKAYLFTKQYGEQVGSFFLKPLSILFGGFLNSAIQSTMHCFSVAILRQGYQTQFPVQVRKYKMCTRTFSLP